MTVIADVDFERLIGVYLRDHDSVSALDTRVASSVPTTFTKPWIKINQIDATNVTGAQPEHLIEYYLQLDCYAGSGELNARENAGAIARAVRSAIKQAEGGMIGDVTVTQVTFTSHIRIPDSSFDPARERYILDAQVRCHG